MLKKLRWFVVGTAVCNYAAVAGAATLAVSERDARAQAARDNSAQVSASAQELFPSAFPPGANWATRQFLNAPPGVTTNLSMTTPKGDQKAARILGTFVPITPCRLVDTRGFFNPVYTGFGLQQPVSGPPWVDNSQHNPMAVGETRTYDASATNPFSGRSCGIPHVLGIQAISVALTTIPAAAGDVVTVSHGVTIDANTSVFMVAAGGAWNTATGSIPVDSNVQFDVQLRNFADDVAIDVNGYYVNMDPNNTSDFFSIFGHYDLDGGLLNSTTNSLTGAAFDAVSPSAEIHLSQGSNAIDLVNGGIRVRQAGTPPVYVFNTTNRRCADLVGGGTTTLARLDRLELIGTGLSGYLLFVQPRNATAKPVNVVYGTCANPSDNNPDAWYLYSPTGFAAGEQYNVMIIRP